MPTTSELRAWWAPACTGPFVKIALFGEGAVSVRASIAEAVHALSACLRAADYGTRAADTGAYNCRRITGGTGYSLHAYGIALDLNWQSNPYGSRLVTDMPPAMVAAIKAIRTSNGKTVWRWGGNYSGNKDAMHFEIVCHPSDIATGIDPATVPGAYVPSPAPPPAPPATDMRSRVMALPQLRQGATGQYVRNMQGLLLANGNTLKVDGQFGPGTTAVLKAWQARTGKLTADGICGPSTWSWLVGV